MLNSLEGGVHSQFRPCLNRFIGQVAVKLQAMASESVQLKLIGFTRREKHPHVVQAMELEALWKFEVGLEP